MKECSYTEEIEDKGPNSSSGRLKGKEFSKILFQNMHELENEIRGMRNGRLADLLEWFSHEGSPTTSYNVCDHSATQSDPQRCSRPTFLARGEEEGETPKEETLGDYLREYESQSKRFKEPLSFPKFFQIKEERRSNRTMSSRGCMQHTLGRNFLPTFDGSPESSAKSWVKKLDTYFQLHQVSEEHSIRVAALHLQGKAYT